MNTIPTNSTLPPYHGWTSAEHFTWAWLFLLFISPPSNHPWIIPRSSTGWSKEDQGRIQKLKNKKKKNPDPYIRGSYRSPLLELGAWVIFKNFIIMNTIPTNPPPYHGWTSAEHFTWAWLFLLFIYLLFSSLQSSMDHPKILHWMIKGGSREDPNALWLFFRIWSSVTWYGF